MSLYSDIKERAEQKIKKTTQTDSLLQPPPQPHTGRRDELCIIS